MVAATPDWAREIIKTWFDEFEPSDWFRGGDHVDRLLRDRFAHVLDEQATRPASEFLADPATARAAIILFDQIPRNLYRDSAHAFAYDPLAREICHEAIARGWDEGLPDGHRQFIAMPLMHSEELSDQEASLAYFGKHLPGNLSFARKHHEMIARFGRFPHRNDVLGRETTAEEQRAIDEGFSW